MGRHRLEAARILSVNKSLQQTKAGPPGEMYKGQKPRRFHLSQTQIVALQFLRDLKTEGRRLSSFDYHDHDLIFAGPNGDYLQPDLVSQTIVRRLQKAGIKDAILHSLR
jgi:hypothetical protein